MTASQWEMQNPNWLQYETLLTETLQQIRPTQGAVRVLTTAVINISLTLSLAHCNCPHSVKSTSCYATSCLLFSIFSWIKLEEHESVWSCSELVLIQLFQSYFNKRSSNYEFAKFAVKVQYHVWVLTPPKHPHNLSCWFTLSGSHVTWTQRNIKIKFWISCK